MVRANKPFGHNNRHMGDLEEVPECTHDLALGARIVLCLHTNNAGMSVVLGNVRSTDLALDLSHAAVDIDVVRGNPQWSVCWVLEPAVNLPDQEEEDQKRTSEIGLEPVSGTEVVGGVTGRVQPNVELSQQRKNGDEHDEIRTPDATVSAVWEFVQRVSVVFPDHYSQ